MGKVGRLKVRYLQKVLVDLDEIGDWIAADNATAATRVLTSIKVACERLGQFPWLGRPGRISGTREWVVIQLPYIVIYRVNETEGTVEILRAYHSSRNPKSIKIVND